MRMVLRKVYVNTPTRSLPASVAASLKEADSTSLTPLVTVAMEDRMGLDSATVVFIGNRLPNSATELFGASTTHPLQGTCCKFPQMTLPLLEPLYP